LPPRTNANHEIERACRRRERVRIDCKLEGQAGAAPTPRGVSQSTQAVFFVEITQPLLLALATAILVAGKRLAKF
jgi:hypothetical protein